MSSTVVLTDAAAETSKKLLGDNKVAVIHFFRGDW